MIKRLLIYGTIIFLAISCTGKKNIPRALTGDEELEFYNTFTEATKHALLGNLKSALALYRVCMENFPEKAAPYYQVSNIYLTVKDFDNSKKFALKAVDKDDSNKWYLLHLANIYQFENNIDSVVYLYEKITKVTTNPEYKYNLAVYYSKQGNIQKSMKLIDELEKEYDGMKELILIKHKNYDVLNEKDSAVVQLEILVKLFPDEFENYGLLAEYLSEINRFGHAKEIYEELLKIEPNNGLANISYGDFYLKQGMKDTALVYYRKGFDSDDIRIEDKIGILYNYIYDPVAIKSDSVFIKELLTTLKSVHPKDSRPFTLSAEFYIKQHDYENSLSELEKAIENGAEAYVVWEQYFMIANFINKPEKIDVIYKEALEKFPKQVKLFIFSAYGLYQMEKYEESISVAEQGKEISEIPLEDKVQCLNQMADSYRGLKQYEVSDSIYEEILKIDSDNLLIRNNYSYYLSLRDKNLERAEELSRLAIKKEPKNSTYLDTYGWILYRLGNYKDALKYIELAIKNGAYNNPEVLEHYGDIVFELGRCQEALEAWNEAIKYDNKKNEALENKIENAKQVCK